VPIQIRSPHAWQNIVEIELETAPGELTPANNRVVVVAEGVRENCACCWYRASRMRASGCGATC